MKSIQSDIKNKTSDDDSQFRLEGRNAVLEALNNDKTIDKLFFKQGGIEGVLKVIVAKAREKGVVISEASQAKLDEMAEGRNHQGVIAVCPPYEYVTVSDIIKNARDVNEPPFIIVLDGIEDPYNLGAIIRTADAAGVHGVIIPKRRACGITPAVVRASAGAVEFVNVARVTNIANTIEELKKENIWVFCSDMDGQSLYDAPLSGAIAIVIGSEGEGVSRLVKRKCDFIIKIPMSGHIGSLNASVAAALVMFEAAQRR